MVRVLRRVRGRGDERVLAPDCAIVLLVVRLGILMEATKMARIPEIVPISDLRQHAAEVLRGVQETREPVVITQRGRAAAVMLSVEEYERAENEREVLRPIVSSPCTSRCVICC